MWDPQALIQPENWGPNMRSPEEWGLGRGSQQCPLQLDGLGSAVSSAIGSGAKPRGAGWFFMHFKNYRYATSWIQELTSEQHQTHHLSCLPFSCRFSVLATELWGPIVDWMGSFSNKLGRGALDRGPLGLTPLALYLGDILC